VFEAAFRVGVVGGGGAVLPGEKTPLMFDALVLLAPKTDHYLCSDKPPVPLRFADYCCLRWHL
jgi:hypothetical protein